MHDALISDPKCSMLTLDSQENDFTNPEVTQLQAEIKDLRNQMASFGTFLKNTSVRGRVRRLIAQTLLMRLHLHEQHLPRKLYIR
jgi:hypothetical protein